MVVLDRVEFVVVMLDKLEVRMVPLDVELEVEVDLMVVFVVVLLIEIPPSVVDPVEETELDV